MQTIISFFTMEWLDIFTTILGLVYIYLEYRASIYLWLVGILMPAFDVFLYWHHGLYGDAGMAVYYTLSGFYGYAMWKWGSKNKASGVKSIPIRHLPLKLYLPIVCIGVPIWAVTYYILITYTDSTVPALDALTNALSFIGLWALAKKYIEQWFFWIVVDIICTVLYVYKGIPFKAGLYGLYVIIAVLGWFKWKQMMHETKERNV